MCCLVTNQTDPDDDLDLGRLTVSVQDGELMLIASWWMYRRESALCVAQVVDVRECLN